MFRNKLAQSVSLIKLDYMLKVMKKIFIGKISIADPNGSKSMLKKVVEQERATKLQRKNSFNSN